VLPRPAKRSASRGVLQRCPQGVAIQHTVLRPALMRRGVGGDDSWGAETHPEYRLPRGQDLVFRFGFQGVR
jgi:hypothetical protein